MARVRSRAAYLQALERQRLISQERRGRERRERQELAMGLRERVSLGESRGEAFVQPQPGRGEREKPVRRLTGVEWLERQGKLPEPLLSHAKAYGEAWERAQGDPSIKSALAFSERVDGGPVMPSPAQAAGRQVAAKRLWEMQRAVGHDEAIVRALDAICGRGMTPREASRNGQEAAVLEALMLAGLRLIAGAKEGR